MLTLTHLSPEQRDLVERAVAVLEADPEIEAAWLAGSLGRGAGDAYSDVDLLVLAGEGRAGEVGRRYAGDAHRIAPVALVNSLYDGRILNVVTDDWRRLDLSFAEPPELDRYSAAHLLLLFNKGERGPPLRKEAPYRPSPEVVLALANEFLRVLGLSVVAVGREEWILAQRGADILRQLTVDLMLEENSVGPIERGGALRRRPLLTAEQFAALESLTPVAASREAVLTSNRELAALFLPRARCLAGRIGAQWPARFEAATKRHLQSRLGLEID